MTKEEKDLVLKDLSARVPYGVYVFGKWKKKAPNGTDGAIFTLDSKYLDDMYNTDCIDVPFDEFMPYLIPLSCMTPDDEIAMAKYVNNVTALLQFLNAPSTWSFFEHHIYSESLKIDWLNEHFYDYRGLIEKGLALKAPDDMYKK